jgi:hypothetical protein
MNDAKAVRLAEFSHDGWSAIVAKARAKPSA